MKVITNLNIQNKILIHVCVLQKSKIGLKMSTMIKSIIENAEKKFNEAKVVENYINDCSRNLKILNKYLKLSRHMGEKYDK